MVRWLVIIRWLVLVFLSTYLPIYPSTCLYAQTTKIQLENGFTLIHLERKKSGLVSAVLFIKGGSADESDKEAGITNLTSQLLPKGTINRTSEKIAEESELLGASVSAGCSNDYTEVSMVAPAENFISAFDIFADVVNNPTFPKEEFEKEKIRTLAGIKSKEDHIFSVAYDRFNEVIFINHPYHKPVAGYEETVSPITISQISDRYRELFKLKNMVLCVAGDIDFKKAESSVKKYFANIKIIGEREGATPPASLRETGQAGARIIPKPSRKIYPGKFEQSYIFIGFPAPNGNNEEYPVIKIINTILGGGMGCRLFDALREKSGLVYEANSFYPTRKQTGAFVLYAGTSKKNLDTVENILNEEIKKLQEIGVEELQNAKTYLKGTYLLDHRTVERQSWYLGWWEIMENGYEYDKKYLKDIDRVSISDIKTVCEKYFNPKGNVTVILK